MTSLKPYFDEFKGRRFLFGFACDQSANALDVYLGTENAMLATLSDPGLCRAIMERRGEAVREEILALKAMGADGIYTGDACASCSFFSPQTYRELFFEYQKRSIDFVHSLNMRALLHICGKVSPILEWMAETGADVIESLDAPSAGGDIDLREAKRRVGHRVCLKGNIDAVHVIEPLSPDEIYSACVQAMLDAGPEGYILSTEQITRDTPAEHVLAMVQARDDFLGTSQAPGRSRVEWNGEPQKKER
jgi:uroporphyrinogen-III decarboxylase